MFDMFKKEKNIKIETNFKWLFLIKLIFKSISCFKIINSILLKKINFSNFYTHINFSDYLSENTVSLRETEKKSRNIWNYSKADVSICRISFQINLTNL